MDKELWRMQKTFNENIQYQMGLVTKQFDSMIKIIEDQEKDMNMMAEEIIRLNKEISELKGLG